MNHFLKEQSLLNAKRIKPSYAIPMFLARLTSQTETQMKKIMKQVNEIHAYTDLNLLKRVKHLLYGLVYIVPNDIINWNMYNII